MAKTDITYFEFTNLKMVTKRFVSQTYLFCKLNCEILYGLFGYQNC